MFADVCGYMGSLSGAVRGGQTAKALLPAVEDWQKLSGRTTALLFEAVFAYQVSSERFDSTYGSPTYNAIANMRTNDHNMVLSRRSCRPGNNLALYWAEFGEITSLYNTACTCTQLSFL